MKNTSKLKCLNPKIYIPQNTPSSGTELFFAFDKVNGVGNGTTSGVADVIADESDSTNVLDDLIFRSGTEVSTSDSLGADLAENQVIAIWFKLVIQPNTEKAVLDGTTVFIETANEKDVEGIVQTPVDTNVVVVGETDVNDWFAKLLERIRLRPLDWIRFTGNVSTNTNATSWFNMLGILRERFSIAFGPLDAINPQLKSQLIGLAAPIIPSISRGYYSSTRYNLCEIFMDVTLPFDSSSTQYDFVEATLNSAKDNPNVDFIVVHCNKAFYATLAANDPTQIIDGTLRSTYHKLFEDKGVHVVISGQFRNYQRQKVLSWNESAPDTPGEYTTGAPNYVISTGQKGFGPGIGCLFIVNGTGGRRPFHTFATEKSYTHFKYTPPNEYSAGYLYLNTKMKTDTRSAKLTGTFYEYFRPTWLEALMNRQEQETTKDQWSITIANP